MVTNERQRLQALAEQSLRESARVKQALLAESLDVIVRMAERIAAAFRRHQRLFLFGNGGSAADAQHLAAEYVNRFQRERRPLPAMALTVDTSVLTSISNDFSFAEVFERQLRALASAGDVALGISTSGHSPNVVRALEWARAHGVGTIGWSGEEVTVMDHHCELMLHVPARVTARIQEAHITVGHAIAAMVEEILFGAPGGTP
jgi:D-sedoheptulose 7-phosphate isomerase